MKQDVNAESAGEQGSGAFHAAAGTQSIGRCLALLRQIAGAGPDGMRVTEIAARSGLHSATAHRLISALLREGFLAQDPTSRRYMSGPELLALAFSAQHRYGLGDMLLPVLERLAAATQDVVYATVRAGTESVCLARREGSFPIRALPIGPGTRRPLGIGAGSLAILAFLPEAERDDVIARNSARYAEFDLTSDQVAAFVRQARRDGFALNNNQVIKGMSAVALPLRSATGRPSAAISIAAIATRMKPARRLELFGILTKEIEAFGPVPG